MRPTPSSITGPVPLCSSAGHHEVVVNLQQDVSLRRLYALTYLGPQPMVITLLLYAMTSITPSLADVGGGTLLHISGEGLLDLGGTECLFAGGGRTSATQASVTTVRCYTPEANATSSSDGCSGEVRAQWEGDVEAVCAGHGRVMTWRRRRGGGRASLE